MRNFSLIILVAFIFAGCKSGWTAEQKDAYMGACTGGLKDSGWEEAKAKSYCSCMMEKSEKKYPDVNDASKLTEDEKTAMAKDCLK